MSSTALIPRPSSVRHPFVCARCLVSQSANVQRQTRPIHVSTLQKRDKAKAEWDVRAKLIEEGKEPDFWEMLKSRGYVKDIAGTDKQIKELLRTKRIGAYVGVDPTAPSLHLGHLLPLMALSWMYVHGYSAYSIVGASTAKVGDPTGRLQKRDDMARDQLVMNITKVHYQLKRYWLNVDVQAQRFGYKKNWAWKRALLNNTQWHQALSFMEPVNRLFKGMRLGTMLSRDTVKRRMEEGDGMSLAEFLYPYIQAWDWWYLYSMPRDVQMQIGGSDQYGNIVAGVDAIKHLRDNEPNPALKRSDSLFDTPIGFTTPLLTDSNGNKFGKSSGNAIWLDPFMTSSFDLYGYFMRRPDDEIEKLLCLFTFLPMPTIKNLMAQHAEDPPKRVAHHTLAWEVVSLVHSTQAANDSRWEHHQKYGKFDKDIVAMPSQDVGQYPADSNPKPATRALTFKVDIELPESLIKEGNIGRILHAAGLANSISEGHRLCTSRGAYIGGAPGEPSRTNRGMSYGDLTFLPVKTWFPEDTKNFLIEGKLLVLRRGKHYIRVVKMVSDKEWKLSGKTYPGEPYSGMVRQLRKARRELALRDGEESWSAEGLPKHLSELEGKQIIDEMRAERRAEMDQTVKFPRGRTPEERGKKKHEPPTSEEQRPQLSRRGVIDAYKRQLPRPIVERIQRGDKVLLGHKSDKDTSGWGSF